MTYIVLYRNLSKNEELKNAIPRSHSKIDTCYTN